MLRISEASLRNEQHTVPVAFHDRLNGRQLPLQDVAGRVVGEVRVNRSGALAGLNSAHPAARAGDFYRVRLVGDVLRVVLCPGEDAVTAQGVVPDA